MCVCFSTCLVFLDSILIRIQMHGQSSLPSSGTNVNLGVVESVAKTGSLLTGHRVFRRPLIIGPNSPLPNNPSPQPSDQYCIAATDRTDHHLQSRFWVPGFRARLSLWFMLGDTTIMYLFIFILYLFIVCIVFEAKDPFYVKGHHQMRRFCPKWPDEAEIWLPDHNNLAKIGHWLIGNLVKHWTFAHFVWTSIHDSWQFGMTSNQ